MNKMQVISVTCLLLLLIMIFNLTGCSEIIFASNISEEFSVITETERLALFMNKETTEIAVLDKKNDQVWYSNPQNFQEDEQLARGEYKNRIGSQLTFSYMTANGNEKTNDSFNDSVNLDQYQIIKLDNGVRVEYSFGEKWEDEDVLPQMISKSSMEKNILDNIDNEQDRELIIDNYHLISLQEKSENTLEISDPQEVLNEYRLSSPGVESEAELEELYWFMLEKIRDHRNDIEVLDDINHDALKPLIDTPTYFLKSMPGFRKNALVEILLESDYTPENVIFDHRDLNIDPPEMNLEIFEIPVEYRLEGGDFLASILVDEIEYPSFSEETTVEIAGRSLNIRGLRMPPYEISFMNYFGAADREDEGYLMVPDGSGALINLNNGKNDVSSYGSKVYGEDKTISIPETKIMDYEKISLPVYGLKKGEQAFLSIIEDGASLATIKGEIFGRKHSYNTVFSSFNINPVGSSSLSRDNLEITGAQEISVYQSSLSKGNITLRYKFLSGDNANYSGMAQKYQQYLVDRYDLQKISKKQQKPFFLELVGAIDVEQPVMGIQKKTEKPLTTFKQVEKIINELLQKDINNIKLRYSGWSEGGYRHYYPDRIKLESVLGKSSDFNKLTEVLKENRVDFFPDIALQNIYYDTFFDNFSSRRDTARVLDRTLARSYNYSPVTYKYIADNYSYLLSPGELGSLTEDFVNDYKSFNIAGLSLRDLGNFLYSDFREDETKLIDREKSLEYIHNNFQLLKEKSNLNLMVNEPNDYAIADADNMIGIPLESSNYHIIDESIPFYQIVLSGYFNYTDQPYNLGKNYRDNVLKMAETGSAPYFKWIYEETFNNQNTDYIDYYSLDYRGWIDEAAEIYKELNNLQKNLSGERIIEHKKIAENVYQTSYENNKKVIVNYRKEPAAIKGHTIDAESFIITSGEEE